MNGIGIQGLNEEKYGGWHAHHGRFLIGLEGLF